MITSAVVSLGGEPSWDPVHLTASAFRWPSEDSGTAAIGDLVTTLLPDGWVDKDVPIITPGGLDPVSGGIRRRSRKYRGPAYRVRASGRGLLPGDLLVPLTPEIPAMLVRPDLVGSMVSQSFLALRPRDDLGLWLWGVLSSRSGRTARSYKATNALGRPSSRAALLDLQVPLPPALEGRTPLQERIAHIELQTHRSEEEAAETWWRTADLRGTDWQQQLIAPDPAALSNGIPLRDLCTEIMRGRPVRQEAITDRPEPGSLPLTDISVIDGKRARRWVLPGAKPPIVAHPGDVLVAAVGNRPHAYLVTEITAVDRNLWLLRLVNGDLGPGLVRYLNGEVGYGVRQLLLTGRYLPGLRKDHLSALPVPLETLQDPGPGEPGVPLDLQLEQALWN